MGAVSSQDSCRLARLPPIGRLERYGFVILLVLIFSGAVDRLIWPPIALVAGLLLGA